MRRYTGPETPGTCERCGKPILWRVSMTRGKRYCVDPDNKQWHACQGTAPSRSFGRKRRTDEPVSNVEPTMEPTPVPVLPVVEPEPIDAHGKVAPNGSLAAVIASALGPYLPKLEATVTVDEAKVRAIVAEAMAGSGTMRIEVSVKGSDAPTVDVGRQHKDFPTLLHVMGRKRNVWLAGPAGSGKTTACHNAAKALGLTFGAISVGPQTTQSAIFGYMDAHGNYVPTEFYRRYTEGGVFLLDEIDRGNPGVLTALNQAIENGACAFPNGMQERHADFIAVACANTFGTGASREYVGALQLDAATLDRFVMLAWDCDAALERDIATATYEAAGGKDRHVLEAWLAKVQKARARAHELKLRVVISPRASIIGADLLGSGLPEPTVAAMALYKGMDADTIARIA